MPSRHAPKHAETDGLSGDELVERVVARLIDVCAVTLERAQAARPLEQTALSPEEAGKRLGMTRSTVLELIGKGVIPAVRFSPRVIRVPTLWIDQQLSSSMRGRAGATLGKARAGKAAGGSAARTRKARSR
jgi:excisionase family DNA binding protein